MTYTIWTRNGRQHPEFSNLDRAKRYMRRELGCSKLFTTEWCQSDEGYDMFCYPTVADLRADDTGAYAAHITRTA